MPAVITFEFDPLIYFGDVSVRLQTLAVVAVAFGALLLLVRIAQRTPAASPYVPPPNLRAAELPFLILGMIPGAVLGGRLDYVLSHVDYYVAHPLAILDPTQGALGLGLAVPGAILGAMFIADLMGAQVDRWMHAATLPTLLALGLGKLTGVLAAEGQGAPSDLPWATAYIGDGPWSSLAAYLPSHPSQVYEAVISLVVLAVMAFALSRRWVTRRDGSALLIATALWAGGRALVVSTWRDPQVLGPLRAEQLILGLLIAGIVAIAWRLRTRAPTAEP